MSRHYIKPNTFNDLWLFCATRGSAADTYAKIFWRENFRYWISVGDRYGARHRTNNPYSTHVVALRHSNSTEQNRFYLPNEVKQ